MASPRGTLDRVVKRSLTGEGAHVEADKVFDGLDWRLAGARPEGAPHSIHELLQHLVFWQDWARAWLAGEEPPIPDHASGSWPEDIGPASREDWETAIERFRSGLAELARAARTGTPLATHGRKSRLEMLLTIGAHNSYHLGQVVLLRQLLGSWPPPGGGLTW